jgi:hypothetical protein
MATEMHAMPPLHRLRAEWGSRARSAAAETRREEGEKEPVADVALPFCLQPQRRPGNDPTTTQKRRQDRI